MIDFLFFRAPLKEIGQNVSNSNSFALAIIDSKMVSKEPLDLTDLFRTLALYVYELIKVVVVDQDKDFVLITFEVIAPDLESLNNS